MADTERFVGVSAYAGMSPSFPVKPFLKAFRGVRRPAIALVWGTFGTSNELAKQFCFQHRRRPHMVEIHFSNEVGRRNKRLYEGELLRLLSVAAYNSGLEKTNPRTYTEIAKRVKAISKFVAEVGNDNTVWALSTGLEDNFSWVAAANVHDELKARTALPIISNPADGTGVYNWEAHTRLPSGADIVNMDGYSYPDKIDDSQALLAFSGNSKAWAVFLWNAAMQGLDHRPTVQQPAPRKRKIVVDPKVITRMNGILLKAQRGDL